LLEKIKLKRKLRQKIKEISSEKISENLVELEKSRNEIIEKINYVKVLIF